MVCRRANIPIKNANAIFTTENLPEKIKDILSREKSVYKILKFCKPEAVQRWEMNMNQENAEMMAKYIVRMATRTTINQLFGTLMSDTFEEKELFMLAPEFYQELKDKIIFEDFDRENLIFKISSQIEEENAYYTAFHCYQGIRKEFILRKGTLTGNLVQYIKNHYAISGKEILNFGKKMDVSKYVMESVVRTLYQLGCLYPNINIQLFGYDDQKEYEKFSEFLQEKDQEYLRRMLQRINQLSTVSEKEFFKIREEIEEYAEKLLGRKTDRRIVDGYNREKCKEEKEDFRIGKLLKRFFTCLGMATPGYIKMQKFEERFVDKYGLFCSVSIKEAVKLYRQITIDTYEKYEKQKEVILSKMREAELNKQETFNLSAEDLEIICNLGNSERGLRTFPIELDIKYQCYHRKIVLPDITFAFAGTFCNAYLKERENNKPQERQEIRYIDCCPAYLPSVGMPMGISKTNNINIDSWEKETDLNDLRIMADFQGIHIIDRKTGKKFLPVNATMISFEHQTESIYAEFLDKLSKYIVKMPSSILLIPQHDMTFIPRICYKNFILQRKTWILNYHGTKTDFDLDEELEKRKVDRYVFVWDRETIYLDLNSGLGKKWLKEYIKSRGVVILNETLCDDEFVTEKIKRVIFSEDHFREYEKQFYFEYEDENITRPEKYTSWHLFYKTSCLSILKERLYESLEQCNIPFFYIHYLEKGQNVLRLRTKNLEYQKGRQIMEHLVEDGLILDYSIQRYVPEVTRYGGKVYIDEIERIFEEESRISLKRDIPEQDLELIMHQVAAILAFCMNLMKPKEVLSFLYKFYGRKQVESVSYYKKYKKELIFETIHEKILFFEQEFAIIDRKIKKIIMEIKKRYSKEYAEYIFLSLIHMRLNRMCGITDHIEVEANHIAYMTAKKFFDQKYYDGIRIQKKKI